MSTNVIPPRVAARPDPGDWKEHELLTLAEGAALMWPDGPLTVSSLRTAVRDGELKVAVVAGKFLTTTGALKEMGTCRVVRSACRSRTAPADADD